MVFKRSDMNYKDYYWSAYGSDDPKITGVPDSVLLNRHEGYEVLYFINRFMNANRLTSVRDGVKAEVLIRTTVPSNYHSQRHIWDWLVNNWNSYKLTA